MKFYLMMNLICVGIIVSSCAKQGASADDFSSADEIGSENSRASDDVREKEEGKDNTESEQGSLTSCRIVPKAFSVLETNLSNPEYEVVRTTGCEISLKNSDSNATSYYTCSSLNSETLENTSETFFYESPSSFIKDPNFLNAFKKESVDEKKEKTTVIYVHDFRNYRLLSYRTFIDSVDGYEEVASGSADGWNVDLLPVAITEDSEDCEKSITYEYNDDKLLVKLKEATSSSCSESYTIEKMYEYNSKGLKKRSLEKIVTNPGTDDVATTIRRYNYSYEETEKICVHTPL